jgi:YfiR/HmsC-like
MTPGPNRGTRSVARVRRKNIPLSVYVTPLLLVLHIFMPLITPAQDDSASEYELKAAMLYNLVQFVEWPPKAYTGAQGPTNLCILGRDPFGDSLASVVVRQKIAEHPMQIRHVREQAIRDCHVLYVSSSERKNIPRILSSLQGSNTLTVGEMSQFALHGGIIQFALEEKRLRFDINLEAAARANLQISSRLLALARIVKGGGDDRVGGINASERVAPTNHAVSSL